MKSMQNRVVNVQGKRMMSCLALDDNPTTLRLYENFLQEYFSTIYLYEETQKALEKIQEISFDLIIIDYTQHTDNGIELIRSIRETGLKTPIILALGEYDMPNVVETVNLHINRAILKPFSQKSLIEAVKAALSSLKSSDQHEEDAIEQDYQHAQQQHAFLKEHNAIRNDFYYTYYRHASEKSLWYLDGSYRPHEILSGDTYSIRRLSQDRCFFFIIDAMGKGVSASVTSIVASSYVNHLIDIYDGAFDFKMFLDDFNDYMSKNLLDEEVLSVLFAQLDFASETLHLSSYAMPPVLLYNTDNEVIKIRSNNMPISIHNQTLNIDSHPIKDISKMLFSSDGLIESSLQNGELYFSHLKKDFQRSHTRSSFLKKVYSKLPHPDDDITLLFFQKNDFSVKNEISLECGNNLHDVEKMIESFHLFLETNGVDQIHTAKIGMIFTEMIMNAYEHGNLDISYAEKKELISKGELQNEYTKKERLYPERRIKINYALSPYGDGNDLRFDIKDDGNGFDTSIFKKLVFDRTSVNGRGFKIAKKIVDALYYSPQGNHVIIHKYIPKL